MIVFIRFEMMFFEYIFFSDAQSLLSVSYVALVMLGEVTCNFVPQFVQNLQLSGMIELHLGHLIRLDFKISTNSYLKAHFFW